LVSEQKRFLEFELEIKKEAIKSYQNLLFSNQMEKFEDKLVNHYYSQLKKSLVLDFPYTDWLVIGLRNPKTIQFVSK